ncbi:MAG: putative soluble lytic transglycosylase fused to an ABC-type amino acid-binding protein [Bacteroidota bacterium]|nr:putative soluble lytic transglycosylase fused to an ABC-type amino acid-binding protein [Bacteroidota bacterium]
MNTRRNWIILTVFTVLAYLAVRWMAAYQERKSTITEPTVNIDVQEIRQRGVLKVIIEYNSISYFIYKGQRLGFEYELMQNFAASLGVKLEIVVAKTSDDQFNLLNEGKGDLIANGLFSNNKIKQQVTLTDPYRSVEQVIVQRRSGTSVNPTDSIQKRDTMLQSALELSNKVVYVADNSIYYSRLKELSDSFGINIDVRILSDDRSTDDIIQAIANGEIDYTIANKDIAMLNKSYFENLEVNTAIGAPQNLHWAVRNNSPDLLNNINSWIKTFESQKKYAELFNKYFNLEKNIQFGFDDNALLQQGMISHYDALIQRYSKNINWDWRLIAAVINQESHFNANATSWCGAQGLMQIMPGTAQQLGVYRNEVYLPAVNIKAGTEYIKKIESSWAEIHDFTQRVKFILASYNAGVGHVSDAARLAEKYGFPKDKWDGSVEYFMLYKSNPRFYNDEVVKYGYCRGQEPFNYVRNIVKKYFDYQSKINLTTSTGTTAFRLEQVENIPFEGIDGVYNPTEGLIARSARRELFLSHKLFDEKDELIPKKEGRNPFDKAKTELFVKKDGKTDTSQLFRKQNQLFQQRTPSSNLAPNSEYKINKLIPRKKR